MAKLSKKAFAIVAICPESLKYYGITVDEMRQGAYKFVWTFPIDKDKAHREGYDTKSVHGTIEYDADFPGCPYCHNYQHVFCPCGAIMCYDGKGFYKCPKCGQSGEVETGTSFDLNGGGF